MSSYMVRTSEKIILHTPPPPLSEDAVIDESGDGEVQEDLLVELQEVLVVVLPKHLPGGVFGHPFVACDSPKQSSGDARCVLYV